MAIAENDAIHKHGTADVVCATGSTSAITDGNWSVDGDATEWTNDDDAPLAGAHLEFSASWQPLGWCP